MRAGSHSMRLLGVRLCCWRYRDVGRAQTGGVGMKIRTGKCARKSTTSCFEWRWVSSWRQCRCIWRWQTVFSPATAGARVLLRIFLTIRRMQVPVRWSSPTWTCRGCGRDGDFRLFDPKHGIYCARCNSGVICGAEPSSCGLEFSGRIPCSPTRSYARCPSVAASLNTYAL